MLRFLETDLETVLASEAKADSEDITLHYFLVFGLCKWLLADRIDRKDAKKVLCRLLIIYAAPSTQASPQIKQCLTVFFPTYCASDLQAQAKGSVPPDAHLRALEEASIPALAELALTASKSTSTVGNLVAYLVNMRGATPIKPNEAPPASLEAESISRCLQFSNARERWGARLALHMLHSPSCPEIKLVAQTLALLDFSSAPHSFCKLFSTLLKKVDQELEDKFARAALVRVIHSLERESDGDLVDVEALVDAAVDLEMARLVLFVECIFQINLLLTDSI